MVRFCIDEGNYIAHEGKFYKQIDGLTIGGSVSGILADFVISDLLDAVIEKSGIDPTLIVKYVDDILAFLLAEEMENFFTLLNNENKSIQFTFEVEDNNKIPYLDMMLTKTKKLKITTEYYQKPTSKNRILNYNSSHPKSQRTSMAYGTISRILTLTSNDNRKNAINQIYHILQLNGYPNIMTRNLIKKYDNKNIHSTDNKTNDNGTFKYRSITYTPHLTENISSLLNSYDTNIKIGFKPYSTVRKILKTPYPKLKTDEQHGLIYKFKCNDCNGEYIGQTGQKLKSRIQQLKTDQKSKIIKKTNTAAFQHSKETGHTFNFNDTKILAKETNLQKRLTLESININKHKRTSINLKSDIDTLNPAYSHLLQNFTKTKRQ